MAIELERLRALLGDRYRVDRELGRGGMAIVYRAEDVRHSRPVAIKVLEPELSTALGPERFLREIMLTARLDHPNIVPLLDSGTADGVIYYVMPLVEGESLRQRLTREKQLPLEDAVRITGQVADALSHAHAHGFIHRELKPENLRLEVGDARLADFGIGRSISVIDSESITATGIVIGTPIYMSAEPAGGGSPIDERPDLYSLACVTYEMLAGEPPYV